MEQDNAQLERDKVFKRNVLRRLYGREECTDVQKRKECERVDCKQKLVTPTAGNVTHRKVYTVTLPPPDFKANDVTEKLAINFHPETKEGSELESDSDTEGTERKRRHRKRRRHHGHLKDSVCNIKSSGDAVQVIENENSITQSPLQSKLSKNQKRKLKKKKHKEKLKKLKADNVKFTYSPESNATIEDDQGNFDGVVLP